jgi:hypothetical protein
MEEERDRDPTCGVVSSPRSSTTAPAASAPCSPAHIRVTSRDHFKFSAGSAAILSSTQIA